MSVRWFVSGCLLLAAISCVGSRVQPPLLEPAELPELTRARELAPDYAARVDSAWQAAKLADTEAGKASELHRAALLAIAARAEAERVAILRQVPEHEARIERARLARAHAERERIALLRARVLEQAAAHEHAEAKWAYQLLATGNVSTHDRDRVWEFLTRRAQALCAAARMLGAPADELNEADLQLTAARTAKLPARVEQARYALRVAQRALGRARSAREPSDAERRDLRQRLEERALPIAASATIELGPVGSAQVVRRVGLLNDLLEAFPHGPIAVQCGRHGACAASWFTPALRERVRIEDAPPGQPGAEVVRVVLPAYAEGAAVPHQ